MPGPLPPIRTTLIPTKVKTVKVASLRIRFIRNSFSTDRPQRTASMTYEDLFSRGSFSPFCRIRLHRFFFLAAIGRVDGGSSVRDLPRAIDPDQIELIYPAMRELIAHKE